MVGKDTRPIVSKYFPLSTATAHASKTLVWSKWVWPVINCTGINLRLLLPLLAVAFASCVVIVVVVVSCRIDDKSSAIFGSSRLMWAKTRIASYAVVFCITDRNHVDATLS